MKAIIGLVWAVGGGILGCIAGMVAAMVILAVTNASNREGAHGYAIVIFGFLGAVVGLVAGILLYGRSAPAGSGGVYLGSAALAVAAVVAFAGIGLWAHYYFMERPVTYDGNTQADLLLELRIDSANVPEGRRATRWFEVEVHTATTRPTGLVLVDDVREEGTQTIYPVIEGPISRAGNRVIVVNIPGKQVEAFLPPMKRVPDPKAPWSAWYKPQRVDPPYGVVPAGPLQPMFELRYRVRKYGDD